MQITANGIKPCSRCLRARQMIRDTAGRLVKKPAPFTSYLTEIAGEILVDNATHTIVRIQGDRFPELIGREVYAAGRKLVDVKTTENIGKVGRVTRTVRIGAEIVTR